MNILHMQKLKKYLKKAVVALIEPIEREFPFLVLFFMLIVFRPVKFLLYTFIHSDQYEVEGWGAICLAFLISYILTLIVYYAHRKWVKVFFYTIGCTIFSIDIFLHIVFHKVICPQVLTVIGETNYGEAHDFLQTFLLSPKGFLSLFVVALAVTIIYMSEKRRQVFVSYLEKHPTKKNLIDAVALSLSVVGAFNAGVYYKLLTNRLDKDIILSDSTDSFTSTLCALRAITFNAYEMKKAVQNANDVRGGKITEKDSLNVIFIIGESYNKRHAQIYGYQLSTTPRLMEEKKKGNLFVFKDVVSPSNYTTIVMKNMMCCNSLANNEKWYTTPFVPTIFKRSGMEVDYWDNQRINSRTIYDFTLNAFLFNRNIIKLSYNRIAPQTFEYDDQLVSNYKQYKNKAKGKYKFIIFHLMGQHIDATERYPHDRFSRFSAKNIHKEAPYMTEDRRQNIADYDNATYYNDSVVSHIIDLYRNENTVVVYCSDHGEEVYDYRDSKGRIDPEPGELRNCLKYQYEVPFVIWCSDKYKALHPNTIRRIKASLNRPFMTDNTCQLLFDLAGLQTIYYRPEHDLISPKFRASKRIVNDNIDYDAVMR